MCWFRLQLPVRFLEEAFGFLRRLAGLLSGYLPTDTRPQARAKLGTQRNTRIVLRVNTFGSSSYRPLPIVWGASPLGFCLRVVAARDATAHLVVKGSMRRAKLINRAIT